MESLNRNIIIFWEQSDPFFTLLMFLLVFGERLFLQTVNLVKHILSVSFDISPFENLYAKLKFFEIEFR